MLDRGVHITGNASESPRVAAVVQSDGLAARECSQFGAQARDGCLDLETLEEQSNAHNRQDRSHE